MTAFKQMLSLEVSHAIDLLPFCGGVLMLSFGSLLISRSSAH